MANPYIEFLKLLPVRKQVVGKVSSVDTNTKTSVIVLLGGGNLTVRGIGVIDAYYLVEEGVIQQQLPALSVYNVEIA